VTCLWGKSARRAAQIGVLALAALAWPGGASAGAGAHTPLYPAGMACGKISSPFGDLRDLDGSRRKAPHTGIDLGNHGDVVIAPARGTLVAIWAVHHPWGRDWNLLMRHTTQDLNLPTRPVVYYSEFDHLQRKDIPPFEPGQTLAQGTPIGIVRHPANAPRFRAEVHLEVYEIPLQDLSDTTWHNDHGFRYWWNDAAKLIDPLTMMGHHMTQGQGKGVAPAMFQPGKTRPDFPGFVYPLACGET